MLRIQSEFFTSSDGVLSGGSKVRVAPMQFLFHVVHRHLVFVIILNQLKLKCPCSQHCSSFRFNSKRTVRLERSLLLLVKEKKCQMNEE